jgi:hypothetical protein
MELSISRVKQKECWLYVRRMRAEGNMARIEAIRNTNKILVGMPNVPFISAGATEFGCQSENSLF